MSRVRLLREIHWSPRVDGRRWQLINVPPGLYDAEQSGADVVIRPLQITVKGDWPIPLHPSEFQILDPAARETQRVMWT